MANGRWTRLGVGLVTALAVAAPAVAQLRPVPRPLDLAIPGPEERVVPVSAAAAAAQATPAPSVGPETNLPLPRFVSLKTDEGNARRGPALDQRIDWVFVREDMPLRITAEYGHWRRVEDRDGEGGWVHYQLLSGVRTVIVDQDGLPLRTGPGEDSREIALLERDVIARLETCEPDWCRVSAGGYGGWVPKAALWGVGADELLD
jgi:SH3-like domain-containing protein